LRICSSKTSTWWVAAAPHCNRNNPNDQKYRITVTASRYKVVNGKKRKWNATAHITLFSKPPSSDRAGNRAVRALIWKGHSPMEQLYVISDVEFWDSEPADPPPDGANSNN
jgi:hypothetical protein